MDPQQHMQAPCLLCRVNIGPEDKPLVLLDAYPYRRLLKWDDWDRSRLNIRPPHCASAGGSIRWGHVLRSCLPECCVGCAPKSRAYLVSPGCWQVARMTVSTTSLLNLGRRMYPLFPSRYSSTVGPDDRGGLDDLEINADTELGQLVKKLAARMPAELQAQIMMRLGDCYAASLIRALRASSHLTGEENMRPPSRELQVSSGPVTGLSAATSSLFGRSYLRDIRFDGEGDVCVRVEDRGVRGIRFAIDTHGLRGIRVLYGDGGESPWLGNCRGCWYGEAHGADLGRLWVTRDGFRIIRVDFDSPKRLGKDQSSAFWSHEVPLRGSLKNTILYDSSDNKLVQFYPGWRLCEYFPLAARGSNASGLTVYWDGEDSKAIDICGVPQVRSRAGLLRGEGSYLEKATIHFPLQKEERITEVWARAAYIPITSMIFQTCHKCLVVTTSLGRSHVFGPYLHANPIYPGDTHEVYWTPLASVSQGIDGLFLDSNGNIGATHSGPPGRPADVTPPALPESDAEPECILTTARLRAVKRVTALMSVDEPLEQVCNGMLLEYCDGSASALGRWNPRFESGVMEGTVVFDAKGGAPLGGLAFRYSGPHETHWVVEVRGFARGERVSVGNGWTVFDAERDEAIEWRWSEFEPGDLIARWSGRMEAATAGWEQVNSVV